MRKWVCWLIITSWLMVNTRHSLTLVLMVSLFFSSSWLVAMCIDEKWNVDAGVLQNDSPSLAVKVPLLGSYFQSGGVLTPFRVVRDVAFPGSFLSEPVLSNAFGRLGRQCRLHSFGCGLWLPDVVVGDEGDLFLCVIGTETQTRYSSSDLVLTGYGVNLRDRIVHRI